MELHVRADSAHLALKQIAAATYVLVESGGASDGAIVATIHMTERGDRVRIDAPHPPEAALESQPAALANSAKRPTPIAHFAPRAS